MYQFNLDTDIEDLSEQEAREALAEFTEKHEENLQEYADLEAKFDSLQEEKEDLEEKVTAFEEADEELAEDVAEVTFMTKEEALGLDFSRKREILAERGEDVGEGEESEFTENGGDDPEGNEGSENPTELGGVDFSEDEVTESREAARERLESQNFL